MDLALWLPDDLLVKVDRMTMAHALEARSPFLDHRVVAFGLSLPDHLTAHLSDETRYLPVGGVFELENGEQLEEEGGPPGAQVLEEPVVELAAVFEGRRLGREERHAVSSVEGDTAVLAAERAAADPHEPTHGAELVEQIEQLAKFVDTYDTTGAQAAPQQETKV